MSFLSPHVPQEFQAFGGSWTEQPATYLAGAAICLLILVRFLRKALFPIGALVHAVAAASVVAFAAVIGLVMLVMAALALTR